MNRRLVMMQHNSNMQHNFNSVLCNAPVPHSNSYKRGNMFNNRFVQNQPCSDLREKILKNRIMSQRKCTENTYDRNCDQGDIFEQQSTNNCNTFTGDDADFRNMDGLQVWKKKLNTERLRILADSNTNPSKWFIVVDTPVLLGDFQNLKFLRLIVYSDPRCRVVVPEFVMNELHLHAATSTPQLMTRAKRTIEYLNTLFNDNTASIGPDTTSDGYSNNLSILRCCVELAQDNYLVILLSLGTIVEAKRNETSFPTFSVLGFLNFLGYDENSEVENNITTNINLVQETQRETQNANNNNSVTVLKGRKITLKRTLANVASTSNSTGKRRFKWRSKRITSNSCPRGTTCSNDQKRSRPHEMLRETIEETSTLNIISNTNSETEHHTIGQKLDFQCRENARRTSSVNKRKIIMFEVTNQVMADHLRNKCDEWVSRFVQIMEEALTQTLQRDPPFVDPQMPPPWTLSEAVKCISKKFHCQDDVLDAAIKLSIRLYNVTPDKVSGKVCTNMYFDPFQYTEMYSYGVYFIDTLQSKLSDSEDIQIAQESLAKLWSEIQDPKSCGDHDTNTGIPPVDSARIPPVDFPHASPVNSARVPTVDSSHPVENEERERFNNNTKMKPKKDKKTVTKLYNLRSDKETSPKLAQKRINSISMDKEETFFTTLSLQKPAKGRRTNTDPHPDEVVASASNEMSDNNAQQTVGGGNTLDQTEAALIEKITGRPELEKRLCKLKNRDEISNETPNIDIEPKNYTSNFFFIDKVNKIQESFSVCRNFCVNICKELNGPDQLTNARKMEIHKRAEKMRLTIHKMCVAFKNILLRESDPKKNMKSTFERKGLKNLDEKQFEQYRDVITKSKEHTYNVMDALDKIMNIVKA